MQSPYEFYNDKYGVRISYILTDDDRRHPDSIMAISFNAYCKKCQRNEGFRLKEGRGAGNEALVSWNHIPWQWQDALKSKFGDPVKAANPLEKYFQIDNEAKIFFSTFRFDDGEYLKPDQQQRYTINASVLNALALLKLNRETQRKLRGGNLRNLWASLISDVTDFNNTLKSKYNTQHTLPESEKLKVRFREYQKDKYTSLIHGNNKNTNAQTATPEMIELWKNIYAGQKGQKPNHMEVAGIYNKFLQGKVEIISNETGALYNPKDEAFVQVNDKTVYRYQTLWQNAIITHAIRSGDRQVFKGIYEPFHKLGQPKFAGSIISIDDRQPPFKFAETGNKRLWFYNGIDLGSEAFVAWTYGTTKEGIIVDFYRQLVRNFHLWGLNLPYELEAELSLNASFTNTFLQPGAMFQKVRIEANNARGKRIEAYYRQLRYKYEKTKLGWLARPGARDEANQKGADKDIILPVEQIAQEGLRDIQKWNNELHSNQELHPGMTRWDVFMDKQHPELQKYPTNWAGILPYLGFETKSSMRAGRIKLQGKHRVVGFNGEPALGDDLLRVMSEIEGCPVMVYYMDGYQGEVIKALVYDMEGRQVCELLADCEYNGDLEYNRSALEQTDGDRRNRELMSAYSKTVQSFVQRGTKLIEQITVVETEPEVKQARFQMPGLPQPAAASEEKEVEVLPPMPDEHTGRNTYNYNNTSTLNRF